MNVLYIRMKKLLLSTAQRAHNIANFVLKDAMKIIESEYINKIRLVQLKIKG